MLDQEAIANQLNILAAYRRTLAHLLAQVAQYGGLAFAPPQAANGIYEARQNIRQTKIALRSLGGKVDDHVDDEAMRPDTAKSENIQAITSGAVPSAHVCIVFFRSIDISYFGILLSAL